MRLQLELPTERVNELKALMAETRLQNYKDLVNNALSVFEWAVDEARDGNRIAAVNEGDKVYRVLIMPAIEGVWKRHEKPPKVVAVGSI
jgi:hypothetical protein